MKNISFTAGPKNGAFVNANMGALHHHAEPRIGLMEAVFACAVVVLVVSFAFIIAH